MAFDANSTTVRAALPVSFPLPVATPDDRTRLEAVVDRLGQYHDRFSRHARRAAAAIDRIERLRQSAIGALDMMDGDADLEPDGCDEPSLAFQEVRPWESQDTMIRWSPTGGAQFTDLEEACEDEGAITGDYEPDHDAEGRQVPFVMNQSEAAH